MVIRMARDMSLLLTIRIQTNVVVTTPAQPAKPKIKRYNSRLLFAVPTMVDD
jgi:hypothetical protein